MALTAAYRLFAERKRLVELSQLSGQLVTLRPRLAGKLAVSSSTLLLALPNVTPIRQRSVNFTRWYLIKLM